MKDLAVVVHALDILGLRVLLVLLHGGVDVLVAENGRHGEMTGGYRWREGVFVCVEDFLLRRQQMLKEAESRPRAREAGTGKARWLRYAGKPLCCVERWWSGPVSGGDPFSRVKHFLYLICNTNSAEMFFLFF